MNSRFSSFFQMPGLRGCAVMPVYRCPSFSEGAPCLCLLHLPPSLCKLPASLSFTGCCLTLVSSCLSDTALLSGLTLHLLMLDRSILFWLSLWLHVLPQRPFLLPSRMLLDVVAVSVPYSPCSEYTDSQHLALTISTI